MTLGIYEMPIITADVGPFIVGLFFGSEGKEYFNLVCGFGVFF
jgi:hypothetical protein